MPQKKEKFAGYKKKDVILAHVEIIELQPACQA